MNKKGIDPAEYIEKELADLKLDPEQKKMLKETLAADPKDESYKEKFKVLLDSLKASNSNNYRALRKIESIAPLYDAHDFWDS